MLRRNPDRAPADPLRNAPCRRYAMGLPRPRVATRHAARGITLIETAVTLSVIAILAAVGLPSLTELVHQRRADATISALYGDLTLARTAAIMSGRRVTLCGRSSTDDCTLDLDWSRGWLVVTGDPATAGPEDILRMGSFSSDNLSIRSNRKLLRFRTDGTSPGANQTIRVCVAGRQRATLVINNAGRPRSTRTTPHVTC